MKRTVGISWRDAQYYFDTYGYSVEDSEGLHEGINLLDLVFVEHWIKLETAELDKAKQEAAQKNGNQRDTQLYRNTPILTGQARSNWQCEINGRSGGFVGGVSRHPPFHFDVEGYESEALAHLQFYTLGDTLVIYNTAPYIERLNDGYSQQAPAGFVEAAVATANAVLQKGLVL